MCPIFLRSSQTSVYPIFSQTSDTDLSLRFSKRKDSLKITTKKKEKKSRLDIGPTAVTSFSTVWALNISALIFDVLALFILILEEERSLFFFFLSNSEAFICVLP